jgi:phage gp45-like
MKFSKTLIAFLILLSGCLAFASTASAVTYDRTLTVGSGSGKTGATVDLPITIDNKTDVAGASFTLAYDPAVFKFIDLEAAPAPAQSIDDGSTSTNYASDIFYQFNDQVVAGSDPNDPASPKIGRVMIAAASAQEFASTTLFNARFEILGGSGVYPIILNRTAVYNPQAGYALPVLVGLPATAPNAAGFYPTPTYLTDLHDGSITVIPNPDTLFTISGGVTYSNGTDANGSTVKLYQKGGAANEYLLNDSTTVSNGTYSFTNKPEGDYRITVIPYDASYFTTSIDITIDADTPGQNFTLNTATALSGTVKVNGKPLPGVRVQVTDADQNVIGVFPVNDQGYFETLLPPAPSGTSYTLTALYGNVELGTVTDGGTVDLDQPLYYITGKIYIAPTTEGGTVQPVTIQVVSVTNQMLKSETVDTVPANIDPYSATYTIDNLLPGNDYIVSAVTSGSPVLYWNQKTDITQADAVDISADDASADFNFSLLSQATITGNVTGGDSATTPIGVFAFETTTYAVASAFSDPADSGSYSMTVPPGSYRLFAISNGKVFFYSDAGTTRHVGESTVITLAHGETGGGPIDIADGLCSLSGSVTYEQEGGPPLAGAVIVAGNGSGQAATVTRQDGSYTITGLSQGAYQVGMNPMLANYALQFESITIDGNNCSNATLDFIIDTGNTVSGVVQEIGGATIADAMIYMINEDTGQLAGGRMFFSGQDGSYSIGDVPDGVYTLMANHPDYQPWREPGINVITDTTQDITMDKGAFISGHVWDETNSDLPGVTIVAVAAGATPAYALTDAYGDYAIYGLDSTKAYLLIASKRTYQRQFSTPTTPDINGSVVDFTMSQMPSTFDLTGKVSYGCDSSSVENARIIASYNPEPGTGKPDFIRGGTTDANGDYSITGLPLDSNYTVTMVPPGNLAIQRLTGIDGSAGNVENLNFTIPCSSTISGEITISTPADAVYVVLFDYNTSKFVDYVMITEPMTPGEMTYSYSFEGLAADGEYRLLAVAAGNVTSWYWYDATTDTEGTTTDKASASKVLPNDTPNMTLSSQ